MGRGSRATRATAGMGEGRPDARGPLLPLAGRGQDRSPSSLPPQREGARGKHVSTHTHTRGAGAATCREGALIESSTGANQVKKQWGGGGARDCPPLHCGRGEDGGGHSRSCCPDLCWYCLPLTAHYSAKQKRSASPSAAIYTFNGFFFFLTERKWGNAGGRRGGGGPQMMSEAFIIFPICEKN